MKIFKNLLDNVKNDKIYTFSLLIFIVYVLTFTILRFLKFDYHNTFGYLDHQLFWEALHRLSSGQMFYRDYYWEYGPIYLIYSLPLFLILNKTFSAYVFIRLVFLPITGLLLAYVLGKQLLKGRYLILFLFLSALYSTLNFETIRHILAELGLLVAVLGISTKNNKKITLGSVFLGISFTSGIEYAVLGLISLTFFSLFHISINGKKSNSKGILRTYLISITGLAIFALFLWFNGALKNYVSFFSEFSNSFFYVSPCRSAYPKLDEVTLGSLINFRRLNLYAIPFINLILVIYIFLKRKNIKIWPMLLSLLSFSGMAYVRTMINPCLNTMAYSVTLLILVFVYLLKNSDNRYFRIFLSFILLWLMFFSAPNGPIDLLNLFKINYDIETEYIEGAGIKFDKEKADKIKPVVQYIDEHTQDGDYIYIYPYGPHNQLTNNRSPVSVIISTHFELAPFLVPKVISELEEKKPEYVLVNRVNAWGYLAAMYIIPQSMAEYEDVPVFSADLTDVEKYISKNYKIEKKFKQAWILKRREYPVEYIPPYIKKDVEIKKYRTANYELDREYDGVKKYFVTGPGAENVYLVGSLSDVDLIKFPNKAHLGPFRYTSQFLFQAHILTTDGITLASRADILANKWQKLWMEVRNDPRLEEGAVLVTKLSGNRGFFALGGAPSAIEIMEPEFYQLNPDVFSSENDK